MVERPAFVIVSRELFGAGIKSICTRECSSVPTYILSTCDEAARLARAGTEVCLTLLEADIVEKSMLKASMERLRQAFPSAGLIVAAASGSRNDVLEHLASGAHGVIFNDQPVDEIARAITMVMNGGIYIPSTASCAKIDLVVTSLSAKPQEPGAGRPTARPIVVGTLSVPEGIRLSARQAAVLELLARGLSNKAIARELGLSEATVKVHNNAVFKALKVNNRASAVARVLSPEGRGRGDWGPGAIRQAV